MFGINSVINSHPMRSKEGASGWSNLTYVVASCIFDVASERLLTLHTISQTICVRPLCFIYTRLRHNEVIKHLYVFAQHLIFCLFVDYISGANSIVYILIRETKERFTFNYLYHEMVLHFLASKKPLNCLLIA